MKKMNQKTRRQIEIYEALKPLLKPGKTKGEFVYIEGYDDNRVAALTGYTRMQVIGTRNVCFGTLEKADPDVPYVRIPELIRRLMAVEKELADLKANFGG